MKRRLFLKYSGSAALLSLLSCSVNEGPVRLREFGMRINYLRPPGALPEKMFMESCINCIACAEACPNGAIKIFTESLGGQVKPETPYIVATEKGCNLCLKCMPACPTGALVTIEKPEDVNMGLAVIRENLCFPYINQSLCGACYTVCPLNAVELEMQRYPTVLKDKCVGCGLCEEVCPQKVKAIRIFAN